MRFVVLALLLAAAPAAAAPPSPTDGLVADYGDGQRRVTEVVATPSFSLRAGESIHPSIKPAFSAGWTGALKVLVAGQYRFHGAPATLTLDGKPVGEQAIALQPGVHPLRIEYRRTTPEAQLQVAWESDRFEVEPIPAAALQHEGAPASAEPWARVERGRALVDELNCRGCHGGAAPFTYGRGPILSTAGARLNAAWVYKWLENPGAYRDSARMPTLSLTPQERADVTAFVMTLQPTGFSPSPGEDKAPPGTAAEQVAKGKELYEKIGCTGCHGQAPGQINSPGVGSKMSATALRRFVMDPSKVEPTGRMPSLLLKQPEAALLAAFLSTRRLPAYEAAPPPGDAGRGRALVEGRGCLGCHTVEANGKPLATTLTALEFGKLHGGRGCLAATPPSRAPRYRLSDAQRADIAAFLDTPDVARAPVAELRQVMQAYRCANCHETLAGPARFELRDKPPSLADTGNKLRVSWIRSVLAERVRTRAWLELRMPHFPTLGALSEDFAALAGATRQDPPDPPKPDPQDVRLGVKYLGRGEEGLSCITCHDFAWFRSGAATPAPDMSTMHKRIRPEWFRRWMMDPQRIQSGTQMPTFFTDVAKNVSDQKIRDVWAALSLGRDMPLPEGVTPDQNAVKVSAGKEPVVLRSFVTGGGLRSILVGFPGDAAFAFDADECRLEFAWSGEFLDARPVWMERGGQKAVPLGERWYMPPDGFPLHIGDRGKTSKPRFRGYDLDAKRVPVFRYEIDGAEVRDRIEPGPSGVGLVRTLEVRGRRLGDVWYVPGNAAGVSVSATGAERTSDGAFHVRAGNGVARLQITIAPAKPTQAAARP